MPPYKALKAFWELLSVNWFPFATGSQPYLIPYHADFPTNRQYNTIEYAALNHRRQTDANDAVLSHAAHPTSTPPLSSSHDLFRQPDTRHQAPGKIPHQTHLHNKHTRQHAATPPSNSLDTHTKAQTPPQANMHSKSSSSSSSSTSSTSSNTSAHHAHRALSTIQAIYSARHTASPAEQPSTPPAPSHSDIAANPQNMSPTTISTVHLSPPTHAPWPLSPSREPLLPLLSPQVSPLVTGFHADVGAALEPFPAFHDDSGVDGDVEEGYESYGYGGVDVEGGGGERRRWDLGGGRQEEWDTEWWVWVYVWVCGVGVLGAAGVLVWGLVHQEGWYFGR